MRQDWMKNRRIVNEWIHAEKENDKFSISYMVNLNNLSKVVS